MVAGCETESAVAERTERSSPGSGAEETWGDTASVSDFPRREVVNDEVVKFLT